MEKGFPGDRCLTRLVNPSGGVVVGRCFTRLINHPPPGGGGLSDRHVAGSLSGFSDPKERSAGIKLVE